MCTASTLGKAATLALVGPAEVSCLADGRWELLTSEPPVSCVVACLRVLLPSQVCSVKEAGTLTLSEAPWWVLGLTVP